MFDFDKFKNEVHNAYVSKKGKLGFSSRLENPSPANLRDYALHCLNRNLTADDLTVFQEFFDPEGKHTDLKIAIRREDLGKLRSVQNYLIGRTNNPDEIIVKLIAILIDFQPRPYQVWKEKILTTGSKEISETQQETQEQDITKIPLNPLEEENDPVEPPIPIPKNWMSKKSFAYSLGGITLLSLGLITSNTFQKKDCAYWNGEQYIRIDCGETNVNEKIVHIKDQSIFNFKKITQPDTLTKNDEHRVWYSKINHQVEFFTASGYHPIFTHKPLKPATYYIIEKYGHKPKKPINHNK